ncbi:MAG: hypothetical protein V3S71_02885 [Acidobacteriota bacterium]
MSRQGVESGAPSGPDAHVGARNRRLGWMLVGFVAMLVLGSIFFVASRH